MTQASLPSFLGRPLPYALAAREHAAPRCLAVHGHETAVDTGGELKQSWRVLRTPTFFLIDKKGNLRYKYEGFLEYQKLHKERVMRAKIEELLKEEVTK
jgi:thioredoxin-related protein